MRPDLGCRPGIGNGDDLGAKFLGLGDDVGAAADTERPDDYVVTALGVGRRPPLQSLREED